jgi:hypothetical protein
MVARIIRSRTLAAGSLCALVIAVAPSSHTAKAFNPQPDPPRIGMVGIADGQTARLNLANVSAPDDVLIPPPCRASLEIFDNVTGRTEIALLPPPCRRAQCLAQP